MTAKIQENLEGKQEHGSDEEVRKEAPIISSKSFFDLVLLLALRHFEFLFVCDFVDFDCACSHAV